MYFILSAAHCVSYRGAKYSADMFSVVLGKYTLYGDDKDSEEKEVNAESTQCAIVSEL